MSPRGPSWAQCYLTFLSTIYTAFSRLQNWVESRSRKVARKRRGGLKRHGVGPEPVSIVFNTSFRLSTSWYTQRWLVNCDKLLQHLYVNYLASGAQSQANMSSKWNPPTQHHLTYALDIFRRQTVFQEVSGGGVVGGLWYLKDAYSLSHSLFSPFFARSLIFLRSSSLTESLTQATISCILSTTAHYVHLRWW